MRSVGTLIILYSFFACISSYAMEKDSMNKNRETVEYMPRGAIDALMLATSIEELGMQEDRYDTALQLINTHTFASSTPLIIQHRCVSSDNSSLSNAVFHAIHITKKFPFKLAVENPFQKDKINIIGEHTQWEVIEDSSDVLCTSQFHDKDKLLAMLQMLQNKQK